MFKKKKSIEYKRVREVVYTRVRENRRPLGFHDWPQHEEIKKRPWYKI